MNLRGLLLLAILAATLAAGAEMGIEFSGVMSSTRETRVSLTNKATGQSQWVLVGKGFAGYTVQSFDEKTDVVVLSKDGQTFRLQLKNAKVQAGAAEPSPEIKKAILNNLRQLSAAADQYFLENGVARTTYDDLVGQTKYVRSLSPVDGENYRAIEFVQGKPLLVTTSGGFTTTYAP